MSWADVFVFVVLLFSLIGGFTEGAVKNAFSLIVLFLAIPLAGFLYYLPATILSFLPGTNWENFAGFFITLAIISLIFHLVLFLPRKVARQIWKKGVLYRLLGGFLNLLNASIGLALFTLVLKAYPIITWLEQMVADSGILQWLVLHLGFIQSLLPQVFHLPGTV